MTRRAAYKQLSANPGVWKSRAEGALSLLTGAVAEPVAGLAGLAGFAYGGVDRGVENINAARQALTYQPRDPSSLEVLTSTVQPVGAALERVKRGLGNPVADRFGPEAGTAAYMIPDAMLAALGARNMPKGGPTMAQMAENISQPRTLHPQTGAIVWHGSPHKFERFAASENIGAGEGAQGYGHGGYVAESQAVAKSYQDALSMKIDGAQIPQPRNYEISQIVQRYAGDPAAMRANLEKYATNPDNLGDNPFSYVEDARSIIDAIDAGKFQSGGGHLYKMDIPDEAVSRMLDWDKPILEQPEVMRALASHPDHADFQAYLSDRELWPDRADWMTGEQLYSQLDEIYGGERSITDNRNAGAASKLLAEAGIPGIRYLDGGSRRAGGGSRNYVTFSDDLVRILERNGVPTGQQPWKPAEWK